MMMSELFASAPAAPLVKVQPKVPGGPWFIELGTKADADTHVSFGPYENPAVAKEEGRKLTEFLKRLIAQHQPSQS